MRPASWRVLMVGAILLLLSGLLFRAIKQDRAARAGLLALERQEAVLKLRHDELRLMAAAPGPAVARPLGAAARTGRPVGPQLDGAAVMRAFLRDPKLQAQYFAARRANLPVIYGGLLRQLQLSADQIQRFEDAVMRRDSQCLDIIAAVPGLQGTSTYSVDPLTLHPLGLSDPEDVAADTLLVEARQNFNQDMVDTLGTVGAKQVTAYENAGTVRDAINSLMGQLATSADPLTVDQANQVTELLANTAPSYRSGGPAGLNRINWDVGEQLSQSVLSPAQYQALVGLGASNQARIQVTSLLYKIPPGGRN